MVGGRKGRRRYCSTSERIGAGVRGRRCCSSQGKKVDGVAQLRDGGAALLGGVADPKSWAGARSRHRSSSRGGAGRGVAEKEKGGGEVVHSSGVERRGLRVRGGSEGKIACLPGTRGPGRFGGNREFSCFDDFLGSGGR